MIICPAKVLIRERIIATNIEQVNSAATGIATDVVVLTVQFMVACHSVRWHLE
jgi:hypothetical protein